MCASFPNPEIVIDCEPTAEKVAPVSWLPLESIVIIQSAVFAKVSPLAAVSVRLPPAAVPVKTLCTSKLMSDKVFGLALGVGNTIALLLPSFNTA